MGSNSCPGWLETRGVCSMAAEPAGAPPPRKRGGAVENKTFDFNTWREGQRTDKASMRPDAKPLAPVTRFPGGLGPAVWHGVLLQWIARRGACELLW